MTDSVKPVHAPTGWKASDSPVKRAFARSRLVQVAATVLALLVLATVFAPLLALHNPFDPANLDLMDAFTPPWSQGMGEMFYPLGADDQGRDVYSAILYGLRIDGAHTDAAAEQHPHIVAAAEVVEMPVGVDDNFDILRVEARPPDAFQQQMGRVTVAGVEQNEPVSGIDQVRTDALVAHVPEIAEDPEGLNKMGRGSAVKGLMAGNEMLLRHGIGDDLTEAAFFIGFFFHVRFLLFAALILACMIRNFRGKVNWWRR